MPPRRHVFQIENANKSKRVIVLQHRHSRSIVRVAASRLSLVWIHPRANFASYFSTFPAIYCLTLHLWRRNDDNCPQSRLTFSLLSENNRNHRTELKDVLVFVHKCSSVPTYVDLLIKRWHKKICSRKLFQRKSRGKGTKNTRNKMSSVRRVERGRERLQS